MKSQDSGTLKKKGRKEEKRERKVVLRADVS